MRCFMRDPPDNLVGARSRRQRMNQVLQAEEPERVLAIFLRPDIGERRARLCAIRTDDARQAEPKPILAAQDMLDAREPFGLHVADPRKKRRRCGNVRDLARELNGMVGNIAFHPPIDETARPAIQ
jgi:hypothetical protein